MLIGQERISKYENHRGNNNFNNNFNHMGEDNLTLIQKIKKSLRDKIADITWKIFLWSIGMKDQQYWTAIYREERNRRCIDYRDQNVGIERHYICEACEHKFKSVEARCPECGSYQVLIDEPEIKPREKKV
jgi:DNA-directed RNA polymerase subunit RPC12/RpoP